MASAVLPIKFQRPYVHPKTILPLIAPHSLTGAKVTLINMPLRESAVPNCAPNGLALLASRLLTYAVDVVIVDLNAYRIKDQLAKMRDLPNGRSLTHVEAEGLIARTLKKYGDQDVIALSGMITTLRWQEAVAKIVRKLQPDTFLVAGNGLATEFKMGLFNWIPELDAVAHSEGDFSIVKIVHDAMQVKRNGFQRSLLSGKLDPYHIGEVAGRHRFLYDGGRSDELDEVPFPAYDLIEKDVDGFPILETYLRNEIWGLAANNSSATPFTMKRSINTVSSRGCPFACKFCFRGSTGERNYGVRSAQNFTNEMRHYHEKYGVDFVGVTDDNFMFKRDRIADLVPILGPFVRETGVRWGTHGRLDEAGDLRPDAQGHSSFLLPKRVDQMAEAGCVYIGFGAESADKETLENMGKGGFILANGLVEINGWKFPRTMVEGIKNTKYAGIHANATWIMSYPGERLENLKTSVAFIKWQEEFYASFGDKPDAVNRNMFVATAYPGTEMFKHPKVKSLLSENFGISFDDAGDPVCDDALHFYTTELDDATKVMHDQKGRPLNFGDMTEDQFLRAREFVNSDQLYKILDM